MIGMQTQSADRLELALRASNEGIWQWDVAGKAISYSDRVLGFLGYDTSRAPNIFLQPDLYLHKKDLPRFKQSIRAMLKIGGQDLMAVDCRYRRPEGFFSWLRIRGACVRDDEGCVLRIAGSMIDISKRKNTESALEDERHLLHQLIENIPNNIYFKDQQSRFVMVNKATAQKMGFEESRDIIGKTDHDFFGKAHADKSRKDEVHIMETLEPQEELIERETWEGDEVTWVLTTKIPWLDSKGQVRGTFGVTSDVSDMVNVQVRLSQAAVELKRRNAEYREELELARQIQQSMLEPSPAKFPRGESQAKCSVYFETFYQPDSEMAGDFYEVFPISEKKAGILICDVMGQGVRAALVVAMLRGLIEKESDSATHPEWFLYSLNDSLAKIFSHAGIQMFATALYVIIDLDEETMSFASAGHPMPIVVKEGKAQVFKSEKIIKDPALGLMPKAPYGSDKIPLAEVDQLMLFTDGIYETENTEGEKLGIEAIVESLQQAQVNSAKEVLQTAVMIAKQHSNTDSYGDDVCLLGVDILQN